MKRFDLGRGPFDDPGSGNGLGPAKGSTDVTLDKD
jgi:hypothetical protein